MKLEAKDQLLDLFDDTDIAMIKAALEDRIAILANMRKQVETEESCFADQKSFETFLQAIRNKEVLASQLLNDMFTF